MKKILAISSMVLLFTTFFVPTTGASDQYMLSHLTFSGSVRLPGVTLPEGTYTFTRVAPGVIRVLSRDHMTVYGTFMTIPTLRTGHTTKQEVVFGEARVGEAPPIATWFPFPVPASFNYHRSVGYEFLY